MIPEESSLRYTNRKKQVILHTENVVWLAVYTIFDIMKHIREKELIATRNQMIQRISDPQSLCFLTVMFLALRDKQEDPTEPKSREESEPQLKK